VADRKECSYFIFEGSEAVFTGPKDDMFMNTVVSDRAAYEALFEGAGDATAVGEASVYYLQHDDAPARIDAELDNPKVIAILRDPAERAFSAWAHLTRDGRETLDFAGALAAEDERRDAGYEWIWWLTQDSLYADAVERLLDQFGPDRCLLLRHDDFEADGPAMLRRVFEFLGVDPTVDVSTSARINSGGVVRSRRLQDAILAQGGLKRVVKAVVPAKVREKAYWAMVDRNTQSVTLDPAIRADLLPKFDDDVRKLEKLTGWDLTAWRT
jgi:hypothetical protein